MRSHYRQLDGLRLERVRAHRTVSKLARKMPLVKKLRAVPGMGPKTTSTFVAWIADPARFRSESGLSSYAGLGLRNDWTAGKMAKRARASKRGNRELKRALFLSARGALKGASALRRRYDARIAAGWEDRKAIRDVARTILFVACAIWKSGREYDDGKVGVAETDDARQAPGETSARGGASTTRTPAGARARLAFQSRTAGRAPNGHRPQRPALWSSPRRRTVR